MTSSSFGRLGSIELRHPYFAEGLLRGARFVEPSDTRALMRAGRLQARVRDGAWHLLGERVGGAPRVALAADRVLWLGIDADLAALGHVTLPLVAAGQTALFTNSAAFGAFDTVQPVRLAAGMFALPLVSPRRPLALALRHGSGSVLARHAVTGNDSIVSLDLRALPPGLVRAEEDDGVDPPRLTSLLVHPELQAAGVGIVVALRFSAALYAAAQPPAWHIDFGVTAERLEYYVVARRFSAAEFGQLQVRDEGFTDDARPQLLFDRIEADALDPASDLSPAQMNVTGNTGDIRIALFRSRGAVPRRERARRRVQLARNNGNDVLVEHLPQPDAARAKAQFVIHLAKP
ncbi:MAG TPA: hypothetical protein VFQ20_01415 [Burkholderiaceae bacterium]|nr:hypothetical protein [Burkholderiaceae bacterium]